MNTLKMSDTPETDFHCWTDSSGEELIAVCKAEFCRKLERERDEAREALMKIEDLFLECTDIYADFKNMGLIARAALEETK